MEVAEIIAIDAGKEPRFNPENRFFDSKEILLICSSLVSVFTGKLGTVIQWDARGDEDVLCIKLAHFSVKEYLISVDIRNSPANMYAISSQIANTSIAESCLALLLHFDKKDSLTSELEEEGALSSQSRAEALHWQLECKFPLAQYAAVNWVYAYNASSGNDFLEGLVSELFLKRDTLENWVRLHDPEKWWHHEPELLKSSSDIGPSIYYASEAGLLKPLKILIETGADVNARGGNYGNALQVASYNGHQDIIHLLLAQKADVNAREGDFDTALQAASYTGYSQIVKMLLDAGADVNVQGSFFGSALQTASSRGHPQVVKILLDAGADVNVEGGEHGSALQAASSRGHLQIVKILLDAGADVNTRGGYYGSALQAASFEGYPQIVKILLDEGADVNVEGREYGSALQTAVHEGNQDVAQILRDHGAHEDVKSMENDEEKQEIDWVFSDSHSILPAPTLQTT